MKNQKVVSLLLCAALILTGCASETGTVATASVVETSAAAAPAEETPQAGESGVFTDRDMDASYSEADSISITLKGNDISCNSGNVSISGSTVTINKEGTYVLSGTLEDGSIVVDADKADKIQLSPLIISFITA